MNLVPRSGGNSFRGSGFINNAGDWSRGNNLTPELTAPPPGPNLKETPGIINSYDASVSFGGPIKRDRLWGFGSYRSLETAAAVPGVVYNANSFDASRWDWVADPSVTLRTLQGRTSYIGRITAQVSAKHRVSYNQEYQRRCEGSPLKVETQGCNERGADWVAIGAGSTAPSPEANNLYFGNLPYHVNQAIWTAPITNKVLLEAGFTRFMFRGGTTGRPAPDGIMNFIPVTEQSTAINPATGLPFAPRANFVYRGVATANPNYANPNNWRASAAYVTGSHEMKVGYQGAYIRVNNWFLVNEPQVAYRFNLGVPNQFTWRLPEWHQSDRTGTASLYVQDKWTRGRLTLQAALHYDRAWSFTPADMNGTELTSRFNAAPISFPRTPGVDSFNDITPRFGAAYDVFGDGRTALNFNLGHYLDSATNDSEYTSNSPAARIVRTGTRNWDDRFYPAGDARRDNKVIDCDIMNFSANGECAQVTGDSLNFGAATANVTEVNQETLSGWNVRQSDWQWGVTVQQQVIPRMSVDVSYNRRWFLGAKVTDNTLRGPSDYQDFTITAPPDPRLPDGGGYPINLQLVTQAASDRGVKNYVTFESDFGPSQTNYWHGVDFTVTTRLRQGLQLQLGTQTGRTVIDTCATERNIDSSTGGAIRDLRNCHNVNPFQTTIRGLASYTVPKVEVLVSGTLRSQPPLERTATWAVPNTLILAAAGRLPPGGQLTGNTSVNILDAEHRLFADNRRTQIDMRFAKIFRLASRRVDIGVDLSNLLNTNYTTTYENAYQFSVGNAAQGGTWGNPTAVYTPRFVRWNLTVDF